MIRDEAPETPRPAPEPAPVRRESLAPTCDEPLVSRRPGSADNSHGSPEAQFRASRAGRAWCRTARGKAHREPIVAGWRKKSGTYSLPAGRLAQPPTPHRPQWKYESQHAAVPAEAVRHATTKGHPSWRT